MSLLQGNRKWINKMNLENPDFFRILGNPQKPEYLYIGCSDARVDPIQLLGLDIGTLFIHRNVGNLVYDHDENIGAVIEYAVNVLKIPNILVVGHYDCGAVSAALADTCSMNWLCGLRDVVSANHVEIESSREDQTRLVAELNVRQQCENVRKICIRFDVPPPVTGYIFDPKDGILKLLT